MSAELLRRAAALMREDWKAEFTAEFCQCGESGHWFDRSICPEPCGSMHNICTDCGRIKGHCLVAVESGKTSTRLARSWLAVADWLGACAAVLDASPGATKAHALSVASAYLGESA